MNTKAKPGDVGIVKGSGDLRSKVRRHEKKCGGFSLVEISLALAIIGVVFTVLIGLLPAGMSNYSVAMNTQTSVEIYQRLAAELQETDFDVLFRDKKETVKTANGDFHRLALRYFDAQGQEVRVANPDGPTSAETERIVYTARIRFSQPGVMDPSQHKSSHFTSLPDITGARFNPRDSTFVCIQVALSRGREVKSLVGSDFLIGSEKAMKAGVPLRTYSLLLTRNGFLPPNT
jgi:uncharacterized protein (TIGR02598 family)